jgi:conjugal transfer ATP-binding protein TraC
MSEKIYAQQMNRATLRDVIPIIGYDSEESIFFMEDGWIGFGFESSPLSYASDKIVDRLKVLFSIEFPVDTFIQVMLACTQDINQSLFAMQKVRETDVLTLRESLKSRVELLNEFSTRSPFLQAPAFVRDFRSIFTVKIPMDNPGYLPKSADIEKIREYRTIFEQTLKSAGFYPTTINPESLLRIYGRLIHWGENAEWRHSDERVDPVYDPTMPINEQIGQYDEIVSIEADGLWLGDKRLRIISPNRLPDQWTLAEMRKFIGDPSNGIRGINGNFYINLNIYLPDNAAERAAITSERGRINHQAFGPMVRLNPKILLKKDAIDSMDTSLDKGSRVVKVSLTIGLFADSQKKGQAVLTDALTYLGENKWRTFKEDRYIHWVQFINALPFCADVKAIKFLQRYKRLPSDSCIEIMPVVADWSGTGNPAMTFVSRSGQLMGMDIFQSSSNYNLCIAAQSGSGKSFLTNDMITSYLSAGAKCWVLDIGRSYEKLVKTLDGDFIEFKKESDICVNPFPLITDYEEEADMLIGIILAMITMKNETTDYQDSVLRTVLSSLWAIHGKDLTIDILEQQLSESDDIRVRDMATQLFSFTSRGEYGRFFAGQPNIRFDKNLTCLELEELKGRKQLQQVVLLILIYQIQQSMYLGSRLQKKLLFIDEAWDLLANPNFAGFIETGYRRFRKYNGAAVTITQSIEDFYGNSSGQAIMANSANIYLLSQKAEVISRVQESKQLMLGDAGFNLLGTVHTEPGRYSEILFYCGERGIGVGRLMVDPYTQLLYSTNPTDVNAIDIRMGRGMSLDEAIKNTIESRKESH